MAVFVAAVLLFGTSTQSVAAKGDDKEDTLPLATSETLTIATDRVTWMSVDAAPDDQRLVIEALGNLYLVPMAGGEAEPLSVSNAFDSQPRFSPDGNHVAFISDRSGSDEVWLVDLASREFRKLSKTSDRTEMASPEWTPDGQHVVVSRSTFELRTYELWMYPLDGGDKGVQITKAKPKSNTPPNTRHNAMGATFDPTGRYVYYARKRGGFAYDVRLPLWQIARRDLQLGREDVLTSAPGSAFRPAISPNGELLVYGTRYAQKTGLRVRNLVTGADDWLAYPVERDDQESRFTRDLLPGYAFTGDGRSIVTAIDGQLSRIDLASRDISVVPVDLTIEQPVARRLDFKRRIGRGPVKGRILAHPQLSPDGSRLAFTAFSRVYVYDLDRGKAAPVSPEDLPAAFPAWSPNGRELVYTTWDGSQGHIYRQRPRANARARAVTRAPGYYMHPLWSRDGKEVIAVRGSAQARLARQNGFGPVVGSDLVRMTVGDGATTVIMSSQGLSRPHFGPEEDRIYLQANGGPIPGKAPQGLVSVRLDGTDRRNHVTVAGPGIYSQSEDAGAQTLNIAPDGEHVLFKFAEQLYVTRPVPFLPNQKLKLGAPNLPLARLTDVGVDAAFFESDSRTVHWMVGNRFYSRALDTLEFGEADEKEEEEEEKEREHENANEEKAAASDAVESAAQADDSDDDGDADTEEAVSEPLKEAHEDVRFVDIDVYLPRHRPEGTLVLTGATAITMADTAVIDDAVIVIEQDRIAAIGPRGDVAIPDSATVIDVAGKFIAPGFIDTHAHFRTARQVSEPVNWSFLANLAYGVTTGMDVQPTTIDLLDAKDRVDAGLMLGPRAFSTGPGVFNNNAFKSKDQALAVLRRYKEHYRVHTIKAYLSGSRKQRQWVIQAADELQLMPTTEGGLDMKLNLTHIIDGFSGLEHALPLPHIQRDVVEFVARSGIAYTPTLLVTYGGPSGENHFFTTETPYEDEKLRRFMPYPFLAAKTLRRNWFHPLEYVTADVAASARKIVEQGGRVGVGAHGQLQGLGYHWELWALTSGGFSNATALELATITGAKMLGLADDIGSLAEGKLADLVVLNSNPLDDIRHTQDLAFVVKGGDMYEAETLNQVWPQSRPLQDMWWWRIAPETTLAAE